MPQAACPGGGAGSVKVPRQRGERGEAGRAFTLIELLVVIAIIAVLAAILFPVFAKARERGKQATCLSNLKQIGTALATYTGDYDGFLPRAKGLGSATPGDPLCLPQVLKGSGAAPGVFACPSDEGNKGYYIGFPDRFWVARGQSYIYNSAVPNDPTPRSGWPDDPGPYGLSYRQWRGGRSLSEFRDEVATGIASDLNPWHHVDNKQSGGTADGQARAAYNVLYADWHVKLSFGEAQAAAMGRFPPGP